MPCLRCRHSPLIRRHILLYAISGVDATLSCYAFRYADYATLLLHVDTRHCRTSTHAMMPPRRAMLMPLMLMPPSPPLFAILYAIDIAGVVTLYAGAASICRCHAAALPWLLPYAAGRFRCAATPEPRCAICHCHATLRAAAMPAHAASPALLILFVFTFRCHAFRAAIIITWRYADAEPPIRAPYQKGCLRDVAVPAMAAMSRYYALCCYADAMPILR